MRNYVDINFRYGEIKLWYNSKKQNVVGVLVEAKTDELFFRTFFKKDTTFFSTDGVSNLFELIIEIKKNKHKGFIGIIDADFRKIDNEELEHENVFMTDGHDVEMMAINSQAWNEVVDFHVNTSKLFDFEKKNQTNLKEYIISLSQQIACVRYLNKTKNIGLVFRTFKNGKANFIDYHKFISKEELEIDKKKMLKTIEDKSSKHHLFKNNPEYRIELSEICKKKYELSDFCNGHDIINILAYSLKNAVSKKNISGIDIEAQLIIAYRYDDFKKTELFKLLDNWDNKNTKYSLLK